MSSCLQVDICLKNENHLQFETNYDKRSGTIFIILGESGWKIERFFHSVVDGESLLKAIESSTGDDSIRNRIDDNVLSDIQKIDKLDDLAWITMEEFYENDNYEQGLVGLKSTFRYFFELKYSEFEYDDDASYIPKESQEVVENTIISSEDWYETTVELGNAEIKLIATFHENRERIDDYEELGKLLNTSSGSELIQAFSKITGFSEKKDKIEEFYDKTTQLSGRRGLDKFKERDMKRPGSYIKIRDSISRPKPENEHELVEYKTIDTTIDYYGMAARHLLWILEDDCIEHHRTVRIIEDGVETFEEKDY